MTKPLLPGWSGRPLRTVLLACGLAALAAPAASAAVAPSAAGPSSAGRSGDAQPICAWPQRGGADNANVFFPDSAATYWVMPYDVRPDLRITVSGGFPDARYAAFSVYHGDGGPFTSNGVESWIADHQIDPDAGSGNPWRQADPSGGRFTLTVRMDAAAGQRNTLPLAPTDAAEGSTGRLVYRVYLPAGGDASAVPLPSLTLTQGGASVALPPCDVAAATRAGRDAAERDAGAPAGTVRSAAIVRHARDTAGPPVAFARDDGEQSLFPNPDNAYLSAWVDPPGPRDVVVVRAKAPRAVTGDHPAPWPGEGVQLRYWSLCDNLQYPLLPVVVNQLPGGEVDYGCRYDDVTALDADGWYTFVVGTEAQRRTIERVPGVTFLPFSSSRPNERHLLLLRHMLPAGGFPAAVQQVPRDNDPASAAAVMGVYYPRAVVCPLATLVGGGPAACPLGG